MKRLNVVGILGTSYYGSTAFGMAMGSHPDARFVGEVAMAVQGLYRPSPPSQDTLNWHTGRFRRATPYAGSVLCHECGDGCSIWRPHEYPLDSRTVHRTLADRLQTTTLIDSSKYAEAYRLFENAPVDSWSYILLIKTPERQLASYRRNQNLDGPLAADNYCHVYNQAVGFLRGKRHIVSDYCEFAARPVAILDRVAIQAGLSTGKIDPADYGKRAFHQISGNWRASQAKAPIHVDETWIALRSEINIYDLSRMRDTYYMVTGQPPRQE